MTSQGLMDHGKVPFETNISEAQSLETVSRYMMATRLNPSSATARAFNWSSGGAPDDSEAKSKDSLKREREVYLGESPVSLRSLGGDGVYAKTSGAGQVKLIQETALARKTHGRIKVQFHWDRDGKNDEHSSCWVRVAQTSAGVGFGAVFIPRKGQEVVVTFLEGDPDRPLVIGSVYNGVSKPPYHLPAEKSRSVSRLGTPASPAQRSRCAWRHELSCGAMREVQPSPWRR